LTLISRLGIALALFVAALTLACSSGTKGNGDTCSADDADGMNGGSTTLDLTIDDTAFTPAILKTENRANVTLTVKNAGTKPHDFVVACLATPNGNGCPTTSCFPDAATIGSIPPDASVTTTFTTPSPEGIYDFKSDLTGDTQTGQFIVQ
jgi:hypothetical protein